MEAGINPPGSLHGPSASEVLVHLEAVARSPGFVAAPRKGQLLRYLVKRSLAGEATNEYAIGVDIFGRPESFDPREDSIVRTEATRLRQKLRQYYQSEGQSDRIRIELPLRIYTPVFVARDAGTSANGGELQAVSPPPPSIDRRRPARAWVLGVGMAATVAIVAGIILAWNRPGTAVTTPSVAILPFLNLTGDSTQEYMSDSITDELTEELAEAGGMRVVARTSAFQFKGKEQDVRDIGRRLKVGAIVEGSIRRTGEDLELVVQLVSAQNGYHLWSKTFDVPDRDLRRAETEVVESTRRALLPAQPNPVQHVSGTQSPEAHNLYLQAVYLFYKADPESLRKALELARNAVKLDPDFVRPHSLIVKAESNLAALGRQSPGDAAEHSAGDLRAVLRLDPGSPEARTFIAFRTYVREWDWPKAESEFRAALAGNGPMGNTHNLYGWSLMTRGRFAEAHAQFDAGLEIDPLVQTGARSNSAIAWLLQRRYGDARRVIDSMFSLNGKSVSAYGLLSWIALAEGNCPALQEIQEKWWSLVPSDKGWVSPIYECRCGSPDGARQRLADATKDGTPRYFPPYGAAEAYGILGDRERAFEFLQKAAEEKSDTILYLQVDPLLDPVRKDARIQALATRIGLPAPAF